MVHSTSNVIIAECQALWTFAYLNGRIAIDREDVYHQTALLSRYGKHRYPCGFSAWYPEFVYDAVPYADMLLSDLGLNQKRKSTLRKEIFEGYTIHDYRGINQEWKEAQMKRTKIAWDRLVDPLESSFLSSRNKWLQQLLFLHINPQNFYFYRLSCVFHWFWFSFLYVITFGTSDKVVFLKSKI